LFASPEGAEGVRASLHITIKKPALSGRLCDCQQINAICLTSSPEQSEQQQEQPGQREPHQPEQRHQQQGPEQRERRERRPEQGLVLSSGRQQPLSRPRVQRGGSSTFSCVEASFVGCKKTGTGTQKFGNRAHIVLKMRKISIVFIVHEDSVF
jgi:hypothetical protein